MSDISRRAILVRAGSLAVCSAVGFQCVAVGDAEAMYEIPAVTPNYWAMAAHIGLGVLSGVGLAGLGKKEIDLVAVLAQVLSDMRSIMRQELAKRDLSLLEASLANLQARYKTYDATKQQFMLEQLYDHAQTALYEAKRLEVVGVPGVGLTGSMLLAVLQENANRTLKREAGHRHAIAETARELVEYVEPMRKKLKSEVESNFSSLEHYSRHFGRHTQHHHGWRYAFKGVRIETGSVHSQQTEPAAEEVRQEHMRREFAMAEQKWMIGLYKVRDVWQDIYEKYA